MDSMVNAIVRSDVTEGGGEEFFVPVSDISEKIKRANTFQDEGGHETWYGCGMFAGTSSPLQKKGKMNFVHISHVYRWWWRSRIRR